MTIHRILVACVAAAMLIVSSGCSVYMAANQPGKKDLSVLTPGTPRKMVLAELGAPAHSDEKKGVKTDLFNFVQGYSGINRGTRAVLHGAADVVTLGLWEVVGTPVEAVANGTKVSVEITDDAQDRVKTVQALRGLKKLSAR